jgi:hypothetical protein
MQSKLENISTLCLALEVVKSLGSVRRGNRSTGRLYELNLWMWYYGLGQPHMVTVEEAEQRHTREQLT